MVLRIVAVPLALLAAAGVLASEPSRAEPAAYHAAIATLPAPLRAELVARGFWRTGCPVPLSRLRLLTVSNWGFDGEVHEGQLIVHRDVAVPLSGVFRQLYAQRFPIRHMRLDDLYGPKSGRPADEDVSASFHCRQAVPSPCTGGTASGHWSNHAYGLAVDINPVENPYVGCGRTRDPASAPYLDRSPLRKGMVTPGVVGAFRSIGWGWGGAWTHGTKDYMHFSFNGR